MSVEIIRLGVEAGCVGGHFGTKCVLTEFSGTRGEGLHISAVQVC